jgi:hypothetical protein
MTGRAFDATEHAIRGMFAQGDAAPAAVEAVPVEESGSKDVEAGKK